MPLYEGFEEIEFVSIVDILRRGGLEVIIAGESSSVVGAHSIEIKTDKLISEIDAKSLSAIILAGGYNGMLNLCNSKEILAIIKELDSVNKLVAAICASPIVLGKAGVLKNRFCCYPGCEDSTNSSVKCVDEVVCVDNNIITSIGPASAIPFALECLKFIGGEKVAQKVYDEILLERVRKG